MNKISSKLAAGVRQVKAKQGDAETAKPAMQESRASHKAEAPRARRTGDGSLQLRPMAVWPD